MEDNKVLEMLAKIYDNMTEDQKKRALECETAEDFMAIVEGEGVEMPDEMFDDVAGGVAINANMINSATLNTATINSATLNQATINQNTLNAAMINQNTLNQATINQNTLNQNTLNAATINKMTSITSSKKFGDTLTSITKIFGK